MGTVQSEQGLSWKRSAGQDIYRVLSGRKVLIYESVIYPRPTPRPDTVAV